LPALSAVPDEESRMATRKQRAFTLMEILVILFIVAVLSGLLLPVVSSVRRAARAAECQSHLTAIMQGMSLYLKDNQDV